MKVFKFFFNRKRIFDIDDRHIDEFICNQNENHFDFDFHYLIKRIIFD